MNSFKFSLFVGNYCGREISVKNALLLNNVSLHLYRAELIAYIQYEDTMTTRSEDGGRIIHQIIIIIGDVCGKTWQRWIFLEHLTRQASWQ